MPAEDVAMLAPVEDLDDMVVDDTEDDDDEDVELAPPPPPVARPRPAPAAHRHPLAKATEKPHGVSGWLGKSREELRDWSNSSVDRMRNSKESRFVKGLPTADDKEPAPRRDCEMERVTKTTEIYADTRVHANCRGCEAPIVFAELVKGGKRMPFDLPLVALTTRHDDGGRLVESVDLGESHFATCRNADRFRTARR